MLPLKVPTVDAFLARLPQEAAADFVEWSEGTSAGDIYQELLLGEIPVSEFLSHHMNDSITDDRGRSYNAADNSFFKGLNNLFSF